MPIAWGVSSYAKWYNIIWFNNGYHAEHHYRPKLHWTRMKQFHEAIAAQQVQEGVRTIQPCHALGFLDPDLPPVKWWGRAKLPSPGIPGEGAGRGFSREPSAAIEQQSLKTPIMDPSGAPPL